MSWQKEVKEIAPRRELRKQMGGQEGIERQRRRGKLTVRERIDALVDPGGFEEFYSLAGAARYGQDNELTSFMPRGVVEGMAKIDERKVVVTAGDFTVRGGSGGGSGGMGGEPASNERARQWMLPYVRLLDAAGGSVRSFQEMGRTYLPDGNHGSAVDVELFSLVPVVSAVMGSVAGLPAVNACLAHFNVMVKDTSQLFPGGPPVVKAALGYDITKEDLGGPHIHTRISGSVDNLAETEEDAFEQVRRFLSYLPANVYEMAPRIPCNDPADRAEEKLLEIIPRDRRKIFNTHSLVNAVLDMDSFFEISPRYGRARVVGLGRLNGYPVGVMANNPKFSGGATDVAAGNKVIRLLELCDLFHLPIISFADEPGFMVGLESEKAGIERAGAALVAATCRSRMPWLTVVIGRLYGVAGQCHHRPSGMFRRYAWPSASWGSMHITGGAAAAYRREIESASNPEEKLKEIEARLNAIASPFRTAEATGQDIIDPRETRAYACEFVSDAQRVLKTQVNDSPRPYRL